MKRHALAVAAFLILGGSTSAASAQSATQAATPSATPTRSVKMSAGIHVITAELADTDETRQRGLMFRQVLAPNHGMLFEFGGSAAHCMWMRNTLIPLAVAFIDDDGTIANIEEMKPQTDASHCAVHPVRFALEMSSGWFASHGIKPGAKLTKIAGN